jgi:V/A-type H+-transporting ATPase subunit C
MRNIVGTEIDLLNILWIFRLKKYYRVEGTQVYAHLIPVNHRLRTAALSRIAECDTLASFFEEVSAGPYGGVFSPAFEQPERSFTRRMRRVYDTEIRKGTQSLAVTIRYLFNMEQEINHITTVLEGVRYGIAPEEIMEYLEVA